MQVNGEVSSDNRKGSAGNHGIETNHMMAIKTGGDYE
jgi:hypothetical protein